MKHPLSQRTWQKSGTEASCECCIRDNSKSL